MIDTVGIFVLLAYLEIATFNKIDVLVACAFSYEYGTFGQSDWVERGQYLFYLIFSPVGKEGCLK